MGNKDDDHEEEVVHKDPSAFVPSVTAYWSSSDDGDVDMLRVDDVDLDLDGDGVHKNTDMDADRSDAEAAVKVSSMGKRNRRRTTLTTTGGLTQVLLGLPPPTQKPNALQRSN